LVVVGRKAWKEARKRAIRDKVAPDWLLRTFKETYKELRKEGWDEWRALAIARERVRVELKLAGLLLEEVIRELTGNEERARKARERLEELADEFMEAVEERVLAMRGKLLGSVRAEVRAERLIVEFGNRAVRVVMEEWV
jgi:hypothetical protein